MRIVKLSTNAPRCLRARSEVARSRGPRGRGDLELCVWGAVSDAEATFLIVSNESYRQSLHSPSA